jgi:coenzyme F420-reducing hydrogenase beta subunit
MTKVYSPGEIVNSGLCIGCGSCVGQSQGPGVRMSFDKYGFLKATGNNQWLRTPSAPFTNTCPFSPAAAKEDTIAADLYPTAPNIDSHLGRYQTAYVGYAAEENFRMQGSSGGMVTWVASELLRKGLINAVAHVVASGNPLAEGKYFKYRISTTEEEIRQGAKSRYYPIELSGVLDMIRSQPGRYAVVGIPCFIKAINLLRRNDPLFRERIVFTLGLFCGHMKSARFIQSLAWQMKVPSEQIKSVEFRQKDPNRPANWYNAKLTLFSGEEVNRDWFHLADGDWGAGFFMNSACNFCDDVVAETADISFGDAWVEPYSSDGKGTNVVIVRSTIIDELVKNAISEERLKLDIVNSEFVIQTQAAGFRQRREGLAFRLSWRRKSIQPNKRVQGSSDIPRNRKLIYRIRYHISSWSHKMSRLSLLFNMPNLYIIWAKTISAVYHGLAYQRGKVGVIMKRLHLA